MSDDADFWVGPADRPDTYQLISILGGGGEGDVWKAVLPLSDAGRRQVAVKVMRRSDAPDEDAHWTRFGHLLQSLSHPGLVRVTDVFTGPGIHRRGQARPDTFRYVVMDFVDGMTLRDWVDENPDATAAARLAMLRTVAAALDEMHSGATTEVPVAHGDVKPANIIVRPDGRTVLVDLGLARLTDATGFAGRSNPYAAPELRGGGPQATPEADAFAFAATAAHVLTGQPPPTDANGFLDVATLQRLLNTHPVTARRPMLIRQIMTVVSAPPEARPRQLGPWLAAATDTLSQVTTPKAESTSAVAAGYPAAATTAVNDRPRRGLSRRKGILIGAALVAALLVLGGGAYAIASGSGKHSPGATASTSTTSASDTPIASETPSATDTASSTSVGTGDGSGTIGGSPPDNGASTPNVDSTAPVGSPLPDTTQWVSDMAPVAYDSASGAGQAQADAYRTNGRQYGHSLGMVAGCDNQDGGDNWAEFDLSRSWSTLVGVVGLSDDSPDSTHMTWRVYGDGKILASGSTSLGSATPLHVPVKGVLRLRLWINDPSSVPSSDCVRTASGDYAHFAWGNLQLTA
jgi:serine/threonine protein kinase